MQEEDQPNLARSVPLEGVLDGDKVLERLGHLAASNGQVARVEEVAHPVVILVVGLTTEKWTSARSTATFRMTDNLRQGSIMTL